MAKKTSKQPEFLDRYEPANDYLLKPQRALGRPGLLEGYDPNGDPVIIREWRRSANQDDRDLVEIWRNELRLLHRLAGFPGAEEKIARLLDAGEDRKGFYIVVRCGDKRPLEKLRDDNHQTSWLRSTASHRNRKLLWQNIARVARGLEILHSQGLIHCNLDGWAILTAGASEPDFELTGFEWSMRIATARPTKNSIKQNRDTALKRLSFTDDWSSLARLTGLLLRLNLDNLSNFKVAAHEVSENTIADEISLLRDLIYPSKDIRVDGDFVERRIQRIIALLESYDAPDDGQHFLIMDLGADKSLSATIREASDRTIETNDVQSQITFIGADLTDNPRLLVKSSPKQVSYFLRGNSLVYRLHPHKIPNSGGPSWEFAKCSSATYLQDWSAGNSSVFPVARPSIELMTQSDARKRVPRLRGRARFWSSIFDEIDAAKPPQVQRQERLYRAMSTLHALEMVIASTAVFPVNVQPLSTSVRDQGEDDDLLLLTVRTEPERADLCSALGLKSDPDRLRDMLESDSFSDDDGWTLADGMAFGRPSSSDLTLQFDQIDNTEGELSFIFRSSTPKPAIVNNGLLVPSALRGDRTQFSRRGQALKGLQEHTELLRMLSDPRAHQATSHEVVTQDDIYQDFDPAKRNALEEITTNLPVYFLQGPPGVGKTRLVTDLVRRAFSKEPSSRLLLSAQSHHTVDHLMDEVLATWSSESDDGPLAVRSRAKDHSDASSQFDVSRQTDNLVGTFAASPLAQSSALHLRERIGALSASQTLGSEGSKSKSVDRRALSGLVLRSANLVFATTNARDLELLFEEKGQFDWVLIEEAAKATGTELLLPLLLSHRRLMIGDHNQLPPFGSDKIASLLNNPAQLKQVLSVGLDRIDRSLKDFIGDDLVKTIDHHDNDQELALLSSDARRSLYLFETSVEDELNNEKRGPGNLNRIARVLKYQHRMHPVLSNVVSKCFYDNKIENWTESVQKYETQNAPVTAGFDRTRFGFPLTIIDMPYQQSTMTKQNVEMLPRYTNPDEIAAINRVVRKLQVSEPNTQPSLAILSPYTRQVTAIRDNLAIDGEAQAALSQFRSVARGGEWCSTVDAFQGNEADVVIASLVRNNHHASVRKALGFLSRPERMNVLMSRAKWRLILVTSLDFLRAVVRPLGGASDPEFRFLHDLLGIIEDQEKSSPDAIVSFERLIT